MDTVEVTQTHFEASVPFARWEDEEEGMRTGEEEGWKVYQREEISGIFEGLKIK